MLGDGLHKPISPQITWIGWSHNLRKVRNPEVESDGTTVAGNGINPGVDTGDRSANRSTGKRSGCD